MTAALVSHKTVKVTDRGPGALTGQSALQFLVRFTNNSARAIELNTVQVNVTYGDDLSASPVNENDDAASGTLRPHSTATALYAFAIPVKEYGNIQVQVWLDSQHPTVVFAGSLQ